MGNPASDYLKEYRTEHIAVPPAGWQVRTITPGPASEHQVRVAFPPGRRKKGSGKLVSILHPIGENPKQCNPEAIAYLKAARKAAERGEFAPSMKLLTKFQKKKIREQEAELRSAKEREAGSREAAARSQRRNPSGDVAAKLYKDFHGKSPTEVIRLQEDLLKAGDYTALGNCPELWLSPVKGDPERWALPDIACEPKDGVKLATDAKGRQLYLVGGNQKLPLDYLKREEFDMIESLFLLGEVYAISYETEKIFDGFQTTIYAHEFGEETGERPQLVYDSEAERLLLVGGAYSIAGVDKALKASPGIVN